MCHYYFDVETQGLDPLHDEIITIQFQPLDRHTGQPTGPLTILKAWESSEKFIIEQFITLTRVLDPYLFSFIPVGFKLNFEHKFLKARSVANGLPEIDLLSHPHVDLQPIGVLMRHGEFKGTSLDALSGKEGNGSQIPQWLEAKEYHKIFQYVEQETVSFVEFYEWLCGRMPEVLGEWQSERPVRPEISQSDAVQLQMNTSLLLE